MKTSTFAWLRKELLPEQKTFRLIFLDKLISIIFNFCKRWIVGFPDPLVSRRTFNPPRAMRCFSFQTCAAARQKIWKQYLEKRFENISKNLTGKKKYSLCVYSIVRWKVVECGANWDIDYSHRIHIDSHQVGGKQQKNIVRPSMPESQSLFPKFSSLSAAINRFFPLLFLCVNKVWSYEAPLQE